MNMQDIFSEDVGKGTPLVLVHGFLGSSEMWGPQIKFFKDNFRVIVPALPGFGKSNNIDSCNSIECMARAILRLLDKKKIKNFNLLGHSMGGMIVQEMTKIVGSRVNKLICFATGSIGEIPGRFETIDETREKLKKDGTKITFSRAAKKWFVKGDQAKNYHLCKNAVKNVTLETADNALIAMKNWTGIDDLKNIKNDTLIIWGNKDTSYNFDQVETLNKKIENSKLEIFENCSHNVHLEEVEKFNILVKDFIH